jgi:hypothetical protein
MSTAGLLDAMGRHVHRAAATLLGPGDIEVGAVAAVRIAMTSAVRVAATAGGLGEPALHHYPGGAKEFAEKRFVPNHTIMLVKTKMNERVSPPAQCDREDGIRIR